jgi:hypothetical protein
MKTYFAAFALALALTPLATPIAFQFPAVALAQEVVASPAPEVVAAPVAAAAVVVAPGTLDQATSLLPALIDALINGKWFVVGAIVVMVLTVVFRQFAIPKLNLSTKVLPWVSIVIAFLSGGAAHVVGGVDVKEAAYMILFSGGLASQMWSLGGNQLTELLMSVLGKKLAEANKA